MEWNNQHREKLCHIIENEWSRLNIKVWDSWMKGLGIKWAELDDDEKDAPEGTVAIWEGPGFKDETKKQCWVVPDDVAMKLLVFSDPNRHEIKETIK
jgi:hypothetical protein